jgi:all-trans-8'-apo-beta-carotenal 15,15'-oxygenase
MAEHSVNAFEDGEIVFDYTHYASPYGLEGFVRGLVRGEIEAPLGASIRRARVDVRRRTFRSETILQRPAELPRVAPRVEASRHRFAYYVGQGDASRTRPFDAVLKHDVETGRIDTYAPGEHEYPGEAVFVPREGGAAEDDGWLLTMVYDSRADRTRLDVLDARGVGDGPVAKCWFDQPIAFGFHGVWAAARAV